MPFTIEFNNPLDPASVTPDRIAITPELPGARVDVVGSTITVNGASSGSRTYEVTLAADIDDVGSLRRAEEMGRSLGLASMP